MKVYKNILFTSILIGTFIFCKSVFVYASDNIHWAETYYNELKKNEILNDDFKYSNDLYDYLNTPITREEFFSLFVKTLNLDISKRDISNLVFSDKNDVSNEFKKYIVTAFENGILEGIKKNEETFCYPKKNITRQEACTILSRGFNIYYYDKTNYSDNSEIQEWSQPSVSALTRANILTGYQDNSFKPNGTLTRGEIFKIIVYCINLGYTNKDKISIFAGSGNLGIKNGILKDSQFAGITDIIKTKDSKIYVSDSDNNTIRLIDSNKVSDFNGNTETLYSSDILYGGYNDGNINEALFSNPYGLAVYNDIIIISDRNNKKIRFIKDGYVSTLECKGIELELPSGITIDDNKNLYISDTAKNLIYKVDKTGNAIIFAGSEKSGFKDGNVNEALFNEPTGITYYNNVLYVADTGNHAIRAIKDNKVTTIAGGNNYIDDSGIIYGDYFDGHVKNALFSSPTNIEIADDGTIYVADTGNSMIRKISNNEVTTIAGLKDASKYLVKPMGMFLSDDKLYVSDNFCNRIYIIDIN